MSEEIRKREVLKENVGTVAVVTLNRPEKRNAISYAMLEQLKAHFQAIREDSTVRSVVLTGAGDQAFCAGADLKERIKMSEQEILRFLDLFRDVHLWIDTCPKPVIGALQGNALGGGLEIALACDLCIGSASARVGLPEVNLGIIPGAGGTQRLSRLIGQSRAKYLILTRDVISARQAAEWGILDEVIEDQVSVLEHCVNLADRLFATAAPIAVQAALKAIDGGMGLPLPQALDWERKCYLETLSTEDRLEALKAFEEKRPAVFNGR